MTKKEYLNCKIRCIQSGSLTFKAGIVYEIKNGELFLEDGTIFKKEIKSLDDIKHFKSKFKPYEEKGYCTECEKLEVCMYSNEFIKVIDEVNSVIYKSSFKDSIIIDYRCKFYKKIT